MSPNMSTDQGQTSLDKFRQDGERFQCPSCDSNYSRKDNLKAHMKKVHDESDFDFSKDHEPFKNTRNRTISTEQVEKNEPEISKVEQPVNPESMTQESFLAYFKLARKGTEHEKISGNTIKKTRRSGRLSNPYYDTTQFYEKMYDQNL